MTTHETFHVGDRVRSYSRLLPASVIGAVLEVDAVYSGDDGRTRLALVPAGTPADADAPTYMVSADFCEREA